MKLRGTIEVRETREVEVEFPLQGYVVRYRPGLYAMATVYGFFPSPYDKDRFGSVAVRQHAEKFAKTIPDSEVVWVSGESAKRKPGEVRVGDVWVWLKDHNSARRDIRFKVSSRRPGSAGCAGWFIEPIDEFPYQSHPNVKEWFPDDCFTDGSLAALQEG